MEPLFSLAAPEVRRLLEQLLPTDGDFDAFVLDYFPEVKRRFSGGMERVVKTNLLFESIDITMGRIPQAELMMAPRLRETLQRVEAGEILELRAVREILHRTLKLATACKKAAWFGFIFDFARACRHVMDVGFLDEVYTQIFTLRPAIEPQVRAYAQAITAPKLQPQLNTIRKLYTQ